MTTKTAVVTGASPGGLGSEFVLALQKQGFRVFATVRSAGKGQHLSSISNVELLILDVTSPVGIKEAAKTVEEETNGRLDLLINNSGGGYTSPVLDADIEQSKKIFDVNVWGLLAVTQAFAPMLIASKGTIVNMSSISGDLYGAWSGIYASSKAAVSTMSETLRLELKPFGVNVITACVGTVKSRFHQNEHIHLPEGSIFEPAREEIQKVADGTLYKDEPVDVFVNKFIKRILSGASGRLYEGGMAGMTYLASNYAPAMILDRALSDGRGIDRLYTAQKSSS